MKYKHLCAVLAIFLCIAFLIIGALPKKASSWGAISSIVPTHQIINERAYALLQSDPAFDPTKFPPLADIQANEGVSPLTAQGLLKGKGPDIEGASKYADHYYNPRTGKGGGPDSVMTEYVHLVDAMAAGERTDAAHAASWLAHFTADMTVPYHVQGTTRAEIEQIYKSYGGANAHAIPLPISITGPLNLSNNLIVTNDFKSSVEGFFRDTASHADSDDWFDPWYWNGWTSTLLDSSHVVWEGMAGGTENFPLEVSGYNLLWSNTGLDFSQRWLGQSTQAKKFAQDLAKWTQLMMDNPQRQDLSSPTAYLETAIQSVYTIWRASMSALQARIDVKVPDPAQPRKFNVCGMVSNLALQEAYGLQVKLTLKGGTIVGGGTVDVQSLESIAGKSRSSVCWDVETSGSGACTATVEVIGSIYMTPDLGYTKTETTFGGKMQVIPVTPEHPGDLNSSMVFCLDNSDSMKGQPIIDARNAALTALDAVPSSGVEMALYFFGAGGGCDVELIQGFTGDKSLMRAGIQNATASGNTPLADAIAQSGKYLKENARGKSGVIILLTDGVETCEGDPVAAARDLNPAHSSWNPFVSHAYAASNIPIKLQVVGFNIEQAQSEQYLREIAAAGNGQYYSAANAEELETALTSAVAQPSGKGSFPVWGIGMIVGGAILVLVLVLLLLWRRRPARVTVQASTPIPTTMTPASSMPYPTTPDRNTVQTAAKADYCPGCGALKQPAAAFCSSCGASLAAQTQPAQVYCFKCGSAVTQDSAFCSKCGTKLLLPVEVFCSRCGVTNPEGSAFCKNCGSGLVLQVRQAQAAGKTGTSPMWWLLPVFLLLVGGIITWLVLRKKDPVKARGALIVGIAISAFVFATFVSNAGH